jgi:chloride channel protein, CIC family
VTTNAPTAGDLRLREDRVFLILTIVVGILAGLCAVLFSLGIDYTSRRLFGLAPSSTRLFLVPVLMSIVTGVLLAKVFPDVRGSGVPQTEAAYHLGGGQIPARVGIGKFITGILCIGSGHSMGREGPSVQIGAAVASTIGRWLYLSPRRVRDLVPVGAAGALAAAFNTPVAAVLFALEEIIGDLNAPLIGSTVIASVASVIVERSIMGNEPLFHVPTYHLIHPAELGAYAVLGVLGGAVSIVFCKLLLGLRRSFQRMPARTRILQPAMGGLVIGVVLIYVPAVMGVGYDYVDQALNGGLLLQTMALLCVVKLAATTISYASGNAGGIFAPSLYIGAMAGGAVGSLVHTYAPFPTAEAGAYALVGMGTLFAGIIRAPMTSVFMIFEITQDYQILVPLMLANMLSFLISRRYQPTPVYHELLRQDNVHLPAPGTHLGLSATTARHVMKADPPRIAPEQTVDEARAAVMRHDSPAAVVGSRERLAACVTRDELDRLVAAGRGREPVGAIVTVSAVHVHPDHALDVVLERLRQTSGALPVVSRSDIRQVEGIVTFETLLGTTAGRHTLS